MLMENMFSFFYLKVNNYLLLNTNNEFYYEVILQNEITKP
jgi:hypothetical protein